MNLGDSEPEPETESAPVEPAETDTFAEAEKKELPSKMYIPFPYFIRGIVIPLSDYTTDIYNYEGKDSTSILDNFYPGITYLTANPWATGSTDLIKLTAGYNIFTRTTGTALTVSKGTATQLFSSETGRNSAPRISSSVLSSSRV